MSLEIFTKYSHFLDYMPFEKVVAMFFFVTSLGYLAEYCVHRWVEIPRNNLGGTINNQLFSRELRK
jgi:hypothetical protein